MVKFIHTADLQLGMSRRYLAPEAQARFTHARIEVVRALGGLARKEDCEFVVVGGDVFESNQLDRQVLVRALEALGDVGVPVFLLPGNHDPLDAASIFRSPAFRAPGNVVVLDSPEPRVVRPGIEVVGAPWTSKRPLGDVLGSVLAGLSPCSAGVVRVAVGHGAVDSLSPDRDNPALIGLAGVERALADGRVHYVALGDRHSTTCVGPTGRVWYSGAPEATDFDELDPGNALVVSVDAGGGVSVEPRRVGRWRFVRQPFAVDGPDDVMALAAWLAGLPGKAETVVRVDLAGAVSLAERARLDAVLEEAAPSFGALDVWGEVVAAPDASDIASLALSGFAQAAVEELEAAGDDEAGDALGLLFRLSRGAA